MKDYSNYYRSNMNDKIRYDGKKILDATLNGFEGQDLLVNDLPKRLLVQDKYTYNVEGKRKTIIGQFGDFKFGDVIDYSQYKWIIVDFVLSDHKMYDKGVMELCNDVLVIEGDPIKTQVGTDPMGRPIYEDIAGEPLIINCITTNRIMSSQDGIGIKLPDNRLEITIPFIIHDKIIENTNFIMNNRAYKIFGLDYSSVINQNGIIKIMAERI